MGRRPLKRYNKRVHAVPTNNLGFLWLSLPPFLSRLPVRGDRLDLGGRASSSAEVEDRR